MKSELEKFLQTFPASLQKEQQEAIEKAMLGNYGPLNQVRESRNRKCAVPTSVKTVNMKGMRLYLPAGHNRSCAPIPLVLYFHGGGWVFGSVNSCAGYCIGLAERGIAVLAANYPLSPEHPFPEALGYCDNLLDFAVGKCREWNTCDKAVFLGGDSAGGNLAATTAIARIKAGKPLPAGCILYYPVTKVWADTEASSWQAYGKGYGLDASIMETMNKAYTAGQNPHDCLISPMEATPEILRRFPRTLLFGGRCDILHDQSVAFAERLSESHCPVTAVFLEHACHLFITVPGQPKARQAAIDAAVRFITAATDGWRHCTSSPESSRDDKSPYAPLCPHRTPDAF